MLEIIITTTAVSESAHNVLDSSVNIWPAYRSLMKRGYFIFSLLIFTSVIVPQNGEAIASKQGAVTEVYVNRGDDARLVFLGCGTEIRRQGCGVKRYEIWTRENNQLKRIIASKNGNGSRAMFLDRYNSNRVVRIWDDLKDVVLIIENTTKSDQKQYCLNIKCSGGDDINNCEIADEITLVIIEPVTQLNHTMIGSCPVKKLNNTMQGICYADGDPPPDMKIINNNTGEVIKEGCTNNLSYSFPIKEHQRQVTLVCEARNNRENMPISQVLRVCVNYTTSDQANSFISHGQKINYYMLTYTISVIISLFQF